MEEDAARQDGIDVLGQVHAALFDLRYTRQHYEQYLSYSPRFLQMLFLTLLVLVVVAVAAIAYVWLAPLSITTRTTAGVTAVLTASVALVAASVLGNRLTYFRSVQARLKSELGVAGEIVEQLRSVEISIESALISKESDGESSHA